MGQDQVSGRVSVLCWLAAPVSIFFGNLRNLVMRPKCFILRVARLSCTLIRQWYVRERLKSSYMKFFGRYWDLIKHYEVPLSQILHKLLGHDEIHWHPQLIRHFTEFWPRYQTWPYNHFWLLFQEVSIGYLHLMRLAKFGRFLFWTPGLVPYGFCIRSNVETIHSWTSHVYGTFEFLISLGTYFCLPTKEV